MLSRIAITNIYIIAITTIATTTHMQDLHAHIITIDIKVLPHLVNQNQMAATIYKLWTHPRVLVHSLPRVKT